MFSSVSYIPAYVQFLDHVFDCEVSNLPDEQSVTTQRQKLICGHCSSVFDIGFPVTNDEPSRCDSAGSSVISLEAIQKRGDYTPEIKHLVDPPIPRILGSTHRVACFGESYMDADIICPFEIQVQTHSKTIFLDRMTEAEYRNWIGSLSRSSLKKIDKQLSNVMKSLKLAGYSSSTLFQRSFQVSYDVFERLEEISEFDFVSKMKHWGARRFKMFGSKKIRSHKTTQYRYCPQCGHQGLSKHTELPLTDEIASSDCTAVSAASDSVTFQESQAEETYFVEPFTRSEIAIAATVQVIIAMEELGEETILDDQCSEEYLDFINDEYLDINASGDAVSLAENAYIGQESDKISTPESTQSVGIHSKTASSNSISTEATCMSDEKVDLKSTTYEKTLTDYSFLSKELLMKKLV